MVMKLEVMLLILAQTSQLFCVILDKSFKPILYPVLFFFFFSKMNV